MQQDRTLQKQSLLGPGLGQGFPPSSTSTYIQLDVDGDQLRPIPAMQKHRCLRSTQVSKLSLHRQPLTNLWILCEAVGQRERWDFMDAVMS